MMSQWIARRIERIRRRKGPGTAPKLVLAFLLGAGLASVPAFGLGQGQGQGQGVGMSRGKVPELPQQAKAVLGGNAIALVRVVKKDNAIDSYAGPPDGFRDEAPPTTFDIPKGAPQQTVDVSASIPVDYLLQFDDASDPIEVIGVSVLLRAGSNTCVWDCYWANGKKICECIDV